MKGRIEVMVAGGGTMMATPVGEMKIEAEGKVAYANVFTVHGLGEEAVLGVDWLARAKAQFDWAKCLPAAREEGKGSSAFVAEESSQGLATSAGTAERGRDEPDPVEEAGEEGERGRTGQVEMDGGAEQGKKVSSVPPEDADSEEGDIDSHLLLHVPVRNDCDACQRGKLRIRAARKKPVGHVAKGKAFNEEVSIDILDAGSARSARNERYLFTHRDIATGWLEVEGLHDKTAQSSKVVFEKLQTGKGWPKTLSSDAGKEFEGPLAQLCQKERIFRRLGMAGRPNTDALHERVHRTLNEYIRTALLQSGIDETHFVYAAKHFCFLHNRISRTRATGRTPYESRYGHAWPTNKPLLPFGIEVVYRNLRIDMLMSKFGPRGVRGILFGMQETPWAIEVMPERWILERAGPRIEKTQDYSVMSGSFPYRKWEEQRKEKRRLARVTKIERKEEKRSRRAEALMSRAMSVNYVGAVLDERPSETKCSVAKVVHPRSAMKEDGARDALRKELAAIERFEVWGPAVPVEKARLATDAIFVRSHCIFTKKNVHLGPEHHQWKCRLVAGGDRLYDGMGKLTSSHVPYEPPAVLQSVRTALALHAAKGDSIVFVDVTSAYLQAPILGPPVFVWPPTELGMPHGHVVPLKKALYGLPRSGSDFAAYARERLSKRGWVPTLQDKSTYIRDLGGGRASLVLYVDDGMVAGPAGRTMEVVEELRADFVIEKEPQILSDGATVPYLGMKVTRESSTITVDGTDYVENMVTQYREYVGARKSNRPVDYPANAKYEEEGKCRHVRELIGMLMWVARTTRPEIMFAVGYLARFVDAWNSATDAILSQLLSFLRARPTSQITFLKIRDEKAGERAVEIQVHVFCDADFAGCPHSRKSTTGFVVYVKCGAVWNLVEWSSRKQKVVATSTGQAELISLNEATFQGLLPAMNLVQELCGADVRGFMHCDSEVAITWVRRGFSAKVAHLRKSQGVAIAALHEVYQVQPYGKCELCFVKGTQNPADVLTKPLGPNRMEEAVRLLHEPMASSDWTHCTNAREEQECEVRTRVGTVA